MEQRHNYTESQSDMLTKILRRILEKLLKLKSNDKYKTEVNNIIFSQISKGETSITIDSLNEIADDYLIKTLVGQYNYTQENLEELADILFELSRSESTKRYLRQKSLVLYRHVLLDKRNNVDFLRFNRIKELEIGLEHDTK